MKKIIFTFAICICSAVFAAEKHSDDALSSGKLVVDGTAAKIDGAMVTVGEVITEMRNSGVPLRPSTEDMRRVYDEALESIIDCKLILRAAASENLSPPDWVVDDRVREIVKKSFDGDINKLYQTLAENHIRFEVWKRTLKEIITVQMMMMRKVESAVSASPSEMRKEYAENAHLYETGGVVSVSVIMLRKPAQGPVSAKVDPVLKRLDAGEDFLKVAKEVSEYPTVEMKDIKLDEVFRAEVVAALASLKTGERTGVVDMGPGGWCAIIRKDSQSAGCKLSFLDAYDKIEDSVKSRKWKAIRAKWLSKLREDAVIEKFPAPKF